MGGGGKGGVVDQEVMGRAKKVSLLSWFFFLAMWGFGLMGGFEC